MQNAIYGLGAKKKQKILGSRLFQVECFFQHVNKTLIFCLFVCLFICMLYFHAADRKKINGFRVWSEFKFRPRFPLWLNSALGLELRCSKSHQLLWKVFVQKYMSWNLFSGLDNGRNTLRQKAMIKAKLCETVSVWFSQIRFLKGNKSYYLFGLC